LRISPSVEPQGNPAAVTSCIMSLRRSVPAQRARSKWVAAAIVATNRALGLSLATRASDCQPLMRALPAA
jgi:hypothetical protein